MLHPRQSGRGTRHYSNAAPLWLLLAASGIGLAAAPAAPAGGDAGELVAPYVPTVEEDVELMLDLADVGPGDYVIDLGSGDGRIVIAAAERGAFAHGVELEPSLVAESRDRAREAGVEARTVFIRGDLFEADIEPATAVMLFLMPDANIALRPKLIEELRPGTRVVSNSFHMGEWRPDRHERGRTSGGVLLWIVPADVAGDWRLSIDDAALAEREYGLGIDQRFQKIEPVLRHDAGALATVEATLRGDRIAFRAEQEGRRLAFHGTASEEAMHGIVQLEEGGETRLARWRARRE